MGVQNRSLAGLIQSIDGLYGPRNRYFMRGEDLNIFLMMAIRTLAEKIRKGEKDPVVLAGAVASVIARTAAWASSFNLPFVHQMCKKYPLCGCAYCSEKPCQCGKVKPRTAELSEHHLEEQVTWSLTRWITHLDEVYGQGNRIRGLEFAITRLYGEATEAAASYTHESFPNPETTLAENQEKLALEFADVLAWVFVISAMLGLTDIVEEVVIRRYCGNCKRCGKRPCDCGSPKFYEKRANPIG